MKNILQTLGFLLLCTAAFCQSPPQGFKYQAVVRDASGGIIADQNIGMQVMILKGAADGSTVYTETHSPTSNTFGLVGVTIGRGMNGTPAFEDIDWSMGPFFIKIEIDKDGGTNYTLSSTEELLSVPFALFSGVGPKGPPGDKGMTGDKGPIGDKGEDGDKGMTGDKGEAGDKGPIGDKGPVGDTGDKGPVGDKGPIGDQGPIGEQGPDGDKGPQGDSGLPTGGTDGQVLATDGADNYSWVDNGGSSPTYTVGLNNDLGGYVFYVTPDGKHGLVAATQDQGFSDWYNAQNLISDPANHNTIGQNFTDWRMPTRYELNLMYLARTSIGGFANFFYWSSTEFDFDGAWYQFFTNGIQKFNIKYFNYFVRAVRAF